MPRGESGSFIVLYVHWNIFAVTSVCIIANILNDSSVIEIHTSLNVNVNAFCINKFKCIELICHNIELILTITKVQLCCITYTHLKSIFSMNNSVECEK
jgi:hypothetical protein